MSANKQLTPRRAKTPSRRGQEHSIGNSYAVTHGGYSYMRTGLVPGCNRCAFGTDCDRHDKGSKDCSLILDMQDEIIRGVMALPHTRAEDIFLIEELARAKGFLWLVDRYVSRYGPFKGKALEDGQLCAQDVLKQRWVAANSMSRICEQLGLSSTSRRKLKLGDSPFDLAAAMALAGDEADADE